MSAKKVEDMTIDELTRATVYAKWMFYLLCVIGQIVTIAATLCILKTPYVILSILLCLTIVYIILLLNSIVKIRKQINDRLVKEFKEPL